MRVDRSNHRTHEMMKLMSMGRDPRWRPSQWSIRIRSTIISMVVVGLSLGIGGSLLVTSVSVSATRSVDSAAAARLQDITTALANTSVDQLDPLLLATDRNVVVVQLVDSSGTVVRGSTGAPTIPLNGQDDQGGREGAGRGPRQPQGHVSVDTATVSSPSGNVTVVLGVGDGNADATISRVAVLLAILAPVITIIASLATYLLVGRSLRSMERLRRRVSEITAADLSERLPMSPRRDEIAALSETMNDMLGRLEDGQSAQRRFVSDASHELRSPLATIAGALELGRENLDTLDNELLDGTLLPEVARVQHIVEDLLLLARADERGVAFETTDVDLDDVARNEGRLLQDLHPHEVVLQLSPTRIKGDTGAVTRIIRNLVDNAARYARSRIDIDAFHDNNTAYLVVGDDGPGIPASERNRVFDRFVRLDENRTRARGGAGLGLAIVAELVAAHRGSVEITDRPGGGARVTVRFPYTPDA
ncbi:ATP-binding protein [Actinomycetes bacterium M1A6_2h]